MLHTVIVPSDELRFLGVKTLCLEKYSRNTIICNSNNNNSMTSSLRERERGGVTRFDNRVKSELFHF